MGYCLTNARVFDGERFQTGLDVVVEGGVITALPQSGGGSSEAEIIDLEGQMLVPGFIDLQVNGGGGVLFNDQPTVEGLRTIFSAHRRFGTTAMLPTLISDQYPVMAQAVEAVAAAFDRQLDGILGVHLEGPYLSQAKRGVHSEAVLRGPDTELPQLLAQLPENALTLLTVAPEAVSSDWIRARVAEGVKVAIGHSNACYEEVELALQAGCCGFTHLYNAMSPLVSRAPGVVGAALADEHSWCGIIADGFHVHPAALKVAVRAKEPGSVLLVTDAVHTVGTEGDRFELCGEPIIRQDGRVTTLEGVLAGSDLTMIQAVRNAVSLLGSSLEESLRMASLYPAAAMGLDSRLGRIAPGYQADLLLLDDALRVCRSWVRGDCERYI